MQEEVPTSKVGDEFRPTQKDKSPKIKSVKLQQRKHEVIKKYIIIIRYYRTTETIGEKRGESHGRQGIQEYIQTRSKKFCWLRLSAVCVSSIINADKIK